MAVVSQLGLIFGPFNFVSKEFIGRLAANLNPKARAFRASLLGSAKLVLFRAFGGRARLLAMGKLTPIALLCFS